MHARTHATPATSGSDASGSPAEDVDRYVVAAWLLRYCWVVAVLWGALSVWLFTSIGR